MSYDFKSNRWKNDINSFDRWKQFLKLVNTPIIREKVIQRLKDIQARWPQYIKIEEIPKE